MIIRYFAPIALSLLTLFNTGRSSFRVPENGMRSVYLYQTDERAAEIIASIINTLESSIESGETDLLVPLLAKQVAVNLRGGENGLFSRNQVFYILQNYFSSHRVVNFHFSTIQTVRQPYFATGGGIISFKGKREIFQIYVALDRQYDKWVVTQFSVY